MQRLLFQLIPLKKHKICIKKPKIHAIIVSSKAVRNGKPPCGFCVAGSWAASGSDCVHSESSYSLSQLTAGKDRRFFVGVA